jgi:hypothetical protein
MNLSKKSENIIRKKTNRIKNFEWFPLEFDCVVMFDVYLFRERDLGLDQLILYEVLRVYEWSVALLYLGLEYHFH